MAYNILMWECEYHRNAFVIDTSCPNCGYGVWENSVLCEKCRSVIPCQLCQKGLDEDGY
jgi:hypothetical protein